LIVDFTNGLAVRPVCGSGERGRDGKSSIDGRFSSERLLGLTIPTEEGFNLLWGLTLPEFVVTSNPSGVFGVYLSYDSWVGIAIA